MNTTDKIKFFEGTYGQGGAQGSVKIKFENGKTYFRFCKNEIVKRLKTEGEAFVPEMLEILKTEGESYMQRRHREEEESYRACERLSPEEKELNELLTKKRVCRREMNPMPPEEWQAMNARIAELEDIINNRNLG